MKKLIWSIVEPMVQDAVTDRLVLFHRKLIARGQIVYRHEPHGPPTPSHCMENRNSPECQTQRLSAPAFPSSFAKM